MQLVFSLIITLILEFIVYSIAIRKKYFSLLAYSILINSLTNPLANFFYGINYNFLIIELFVFIIEAFLIKFLVSTNYKKAIIISLIANLLSALPFAFFFR
jgi:hypothetical protein